MQYEIEDKTSNIVRSDTLTIYILIFSCVNSEKNLTPPIIAIIAIKPPINILYAAFAALYTIIFSRSSKNVSSELSFLFQLNVFLRT